MDKLYRVSQLAKLGGVTKITIYKRIVARNIEPTYVEGIMHFTKEDAERILEYGKRGRKTGNMV
jgi:hypothetical protein